MKKRDNNTQNDPNATKTKLEKENGNNNNVDKTWRDHVFNNKNIIDNVPAGFAAALAAFQLLKKIVK